MNIFKRFKKAHRAGKLIFTFPDGRKVYQIKDEYLEKLPAQKLRTIQENANYIAYLGVSKHTLIEGQKMIKNLAYEARALSGTRDRTKAQEKIDDLIRITEQMEVTRQMYDGTNETILVSTFDLFFFFDDEEPFEWSEETLERKRHYLNEYPYFRSFFFQKASAYMGDYKDILLNVINFALVQTQIQELAKQWNPTSTSESKTD